MNFIGAGEILLLIVIALLVWGPGKIAEFGKTLGKTIRSVNKASSDLTARVTREFEMEEGPRPPNPEQRN
ncbi:MAG: twin-arginine translocase TatA/TatE family subunit [Dehalococcoidia bacterium]|jgi:sec-independent protein translocase protein TatA